ncbi:MAG: hypothetical protein IJ184_02925 [Alphaproteobacteria bacterium]|nr:hypothetical protein [Alphaproteobacteria bacterium]
MLNINDIKRITKRKELVQFIKTKKFIKVLTNGNVVYAWKSNILDMDDINADEIQVRALFPKLTKDYTCYMIDELGRLIHTIRVNYSVMRKFVRRWFPDCWYAKHIREYDSHDGLPLFQELSPAEDFIYRCRELKITSMAAPHGTRDEKFNWNIGKFLLFTEDNEMLDRQPHAHVCVHLNNQQYRGTPLRDINWADRFKSIFSVRLIDYETAEPYTPDNLIIEDEVEKDCYLNMSDKDKKEIVRLLNRWKLDLWASYQLSNGDNENE